MYICAVANQKGGVGKTTTVQNLGAMLARRKKVLLIDLDAQGNLTDACGFAQEEVSVSSYEVLCGTCHLKQAVLTLEKNLTLLPASKNLAVAELALASRMGRENLLKKALNGADYDFVLIDCPPGLGLLTINALTAAQGLLIPVQAEYYALAGLDLIQETMSSVIENLNHSLCLVGILLTFYDKRKTLNCDVEKGLRERWGDTVFKSIIRDNVALAEAPSNGKNIFSYRPKSYGSMDYQSLAKEFEHRIKALKK